MKAARTKASKKAKARAVLRKPAARKTARPQVRKVISLTGAEEKKFLKSLTVGSWALVFDFDGTLAPLHADPMAVKLNPDPRKALVALKKKFPLYIITGRALRHIVRKIPKGIPIIGEHGASSTEEDYILSGYVLDAVRAQLWRQVIDRRVRAEGLKKEIWIEPKDYSIAVHYRHAKEPKRFEKKLHEWVAAFPKKDRPAILPGKMVFNLLPNPAPTKGEAVRWIQARLPKDTRILYVGDEPTDEHAFKALGQKHVTVFLGTKKETAARFRLPSQASFEKLLSDMAQVASG